MKNKWSICKNNAKLILMNILKIEYQMDNKAKIIIYIDRFNEKDYMEQMYDAIQSYNTDLDTCDSREYYEIYIKKLEEIYEELEKLN